MSLLETANFAKRLSDQVGADPEEIRHSLQVKCRASMYFLGKAVLGFRDLTPHFHRRMCYFSQDPLTRRRLGEHPRGHL